MHRAIRWSCGLPLAIALAPGAPQSLYVVTQGGRIYRLASKP